MVYVDWTSDLDELRSLEICLPLPALGAYIARSDVQVMVSMLFFVWHLGIGIR